MQKLTKVFQQSNIYIYIYIYREREREREREMEFPNRMSLDFQWLTLNLAEIIQCLSRNNIFFKIIYTS
jgi:hypothetical protein